MITFKEVDVDSAELELLEYLNTDQNRDDPWNHSIPVLDYARDGSCSSSKRVKIVMQRLQPFDSPPFQNVAECLDLTRQLLEVSQRFFHLRLDSSREPLSGSLLPVHSTNAQRDRR